MRIPGKDDPEPPGGRAAERQREFLEARFGVQPDASGLEGEDEAPAEEEPPAREREPPPPADES